MHESTRDFSTRRGAPVKVVGSYYLRAHPQIKLGWALKLGIYDGLGWEKATAPNNAFVRARNGPAPAKVAKTGAESPGYGLFVGGVDASTGPALESIVDHHRLTLGFNRAPSQQDVVLELDLDVKDTKMEGDRAVRARDPSMVQDFAMCTSDLIKAIKQ